MKPAPAESGVLPAHDATTHLRSILHPGQTVYLILRHLSRSGAQAEVSLMLMAPPRSPAAVNGPVVSDFSIDVAIALHGQLGPGGGVLCRKLDGEPGAWIVHRLDQLCGFTTPDTALKFHWL